jgi:hypothetical protein
MIGTQINFFSFKTMNILGTGQLYPSISDAGRVRLDVNGSSRLRIARELYWNVGYYPTTTAALLPIPRRPTMASAPGWAGLIGGKRIREVTSEGRSMKRSLALFILLILRISGFRFFFKSRRLEIGCRRELLASPVALRQIEMVLLRP